MAENRHVTGIVTSAISLSLIDTSLPYGKWTNGPAGSLDSGSAKVAFEARGKKDTATGTEGYATYMGPDKASFKLFFDDPYSGDNQAQIVGVSGPVQSYTYSVDFPTHGNEWNANYFIKKKNPAARSDQDEPPFMGVLELSKLVCEEWPPERVKKVMGKREIVTLDEVLNELDLSPSHRVWAVVNGRFLDDARKRRLAIEFAKRTVALGKLQSGLDQPLRKAFELAERIDQGQISDDKLDSIRSEVRSIVGGKSSPNVSFAADAVLQTLNPYADSALRNVTACLHSTIEETAEEQEALWELDAIKRIAAG